MKGKKIITVLIIINILLLGVIYNFINRNYLNNDKLILKAMTETEYETQIDSLNQTHQNYQDYISTSKIQLATAITNKGVETASTSTFETMATNINSIVTNPSASLISYDNTSSGLTANNVQSAVDEIDSEIDGLNKSLISVKGTITQSVPSGTGIAFAGANYFSYNKTVATATITLTYTTTVNSWTSIGTVPKKPLHDLYVTDCSDSYRPQIMIDANGIIKTRWYGSGAATITKSISYVY